MLKGQAYRGGGVSTAYVPRVSAVPPAEGGIDFRAGTFCEVSGGPCSTGCVNGLPVTVSSGIVMFDGANIA